METESENKMIVLLKKDKQTNNVNMCFGQKRMNLYLIELLLKSN